MEQGLKVVLEADLSSVITGFKQMDSVLTKTVNSTKIASVEFAKAVSAFKIQPLPPMPVPQGLKALPKASNDAALALTNVGRVAQDLPFGFMGIQNNLNPLLESFQRLKASTGSTKAALASLGSSLIGAGGVGLALSAVSAAILIYQNGIGGFNKKTKEAKEELGKFAEAARDSSIGVQKQVAELDSLVKIAKGDVGTKEQQIQALQRLNELIPDNIGKITEQSIATEAGKKIIREYTEALEDQATAELLRGRIAELRVKEIDNEANFQKKLIGLIRSKNEAEKRNSGGVGVVSGGSTFGGSGISRIAADAQSLTNANENIRAATAEYVQNGAELRKSIVDLRKNVDQATAGALSVTVKPTKEKKTKLKKEIEGSIKENLTGIKPAAVEIGFTIKDMGGFTSIVDSVVENLKDMQGPINTALALNAIELSPSIVLTGKDVRLDQLNADLTAILQDFAVNGIASLAEGIGTAIAGGGNPFAGFINVLATGLQDLGKYLISIAPVIASIKAAMKTLNPAILLPAGIALVGIGAAIKSKFSQTKFAQGGIVTGPTNALIGETGENEVVFPLSKLNQFVKGMGGGGGVGDLELRTVINGTDLAVILQRTTGQRGGTFRP